MPKESLLLGDAPTYQWFTERRVAVTFGNMASVLGPTGVSPDLRSRLGITLPPGPPLVGSSSLVIWEHTLRDEVAVNLVRYLTDREAQVAYSYSQGYLPVRLDALNDPPYSTDPILRSFVQVLHQGRSFPLIRLGGILEEKIGNALCNVWKEIVTNPKADLEATIIQMLDPIARRFEQWAG
jgi:multiple sugar transport system substrate-binding protein